LLSRRICPNPRYGKRNQLEQFLKPIKCAEMRAEKGGLFMADDMEKNRQQGGQQTGNNEQVEQSNQPGRDKTGQQSGQTGQGQQKKGGNAQNEDNENLDRQRKAS
jgi:hypothetical protein